MAGISRRMFLRTVSVGTAAAGAVAVAGTGVLGALGGGVASAAPSASNNPTAGTSGAGATGAELSGSGVIAHVEDARTGRMAIYVGKRKVEYTDPGLAQQLLRAAR